MKHRSAPSALFLLCASMFTALVATVASAQVVSEGERWYEVELVVFTHELLATQVGERPLADHTKLAWLPRLQRLQPYSASLQYPFMQFAPEPGSSASAPATLEQPLVPGTMSTLPVFGPLPAPTGRRGFRLLDAARDPYVALDARAALFTQDLQRIEAAAEHRVLWHATWRQPALPAARSPAVLVQGGGRFGERHELEGSLRLTDSGGRVQLDTHLWFSSFLAGFASEGTAWTLPELPDVARYEPAVVATATTDSADLAQTAAVAMDSAMAAQLGSWISSGAWQLRDTRLLTLDAFHYLDNPAIGVLVQVRPYSVPAREVVGGDEDF